MMLTGKTSDGTAFEVHGPKGGPDDAPAVVLVHGLGLSRRIFDPMLLGVSPSSPGHAEPPSPGHAEPSPPGHAEPPSPGHAELSPPGHAEPVEARPDHAAVALRQAPGDIVAAEPAPLSFDQHFRTITYDLYGHGDSAPPPQTASLSVYSMQIKRLLTHLGIARAHIVGFSIGGMINRRFAMDFPHSLGKLVIWNSPHDRGDKGQKAVEERAAKVRDQGTMSTLPDALKRWFTPQFRDNQPETVDLVRQWRTQVDAEAYAQAAWVLANGVRELIGPDVPITAPTLVMTCEHDSGSTPQHMWQIAAEIDDADVLEIPQLQHLGLMEDPMAFLHPTIDFLRK